MNKHTKHALLLLEQKNYPLAEKEARKGAFEFPRDSRCRAAYGHALAYMGKFKEAEEEARAAIRLGPATGFGQAVLGAIRARQDRLDEAQTALETAGRLKQDKSQPLASLAAVHVLKKQWETALTTAEQALRINSGDKVAAHMLAMALRNLGRRGEAAKALDSLLARNPGDAFALANYGWVHSDNGDQEKALECFREALRIDPAQDIAWDGVAALSGKWFPGRLLVKCIAWLRGSKTAVRLLSRPAAWVFHKVTGGVPPAAG